MSKVVLNDVAAGYNVSTINSNFDKIEEALNDKVLYRDNPAGEPNELKSDVDANGKNIYNAGTISVSSIEIGGVSLEPGDAVVNATIQPFEFTATAGQTVFSVAPFTPTTTALLVEINGISIPTSDISTSGSSVTIPACELGDEVIIRVFTRAIGAAPTAEELQFIQAGVGATTRSVQSKLRDIVSVKDFGAKGDNINNDTVAIQSAINAVITRGGGIVYFPQGIYKVSSLAATLPVSSGVTFRGEGKYVSILRKISGTAPVLALTSASTVTMDVVGGLEDISFDGVDKAGNGLQITNLARLHLTRVGVINSAVGIENLGSLIFIADDCLLNGNGVGYRSRKANGVYTNLVEFHAGEARSNSSFAFDLGDCDSVVLRGVDVSGNGTATNLNTGGVLIRDTIDDETGFGRVVLEGVWFEANFGTSFRTESATNGHVVLDSCTFYSTEKIGAFRQDINAIGLRSIHLRSVIAPQADAGTVTIACNSSIVEGGNFQVLTDTSVHRRHNTRQASGVLINRMTQVNITGAAGQELLLSDDSVSAAGSANDATFFKQGAGRVRFRFAGGTTPFAMEAGAVGFYNTNPIAKPTVTGARGGNAALGSLLTQLNALGLITDSSTA